MIEHSRKQERRSVKRDRDREIEDEREKEEREGTFQLGGIGNAV